MKVGSDVALWGIINNRRVVSPQVVLIRICFNEKVTRAILYVVVQENLRCLFLDVN